MKYLLILSFILMGCGIKKNTSHMVRKMENKIFKVTHVGMCQQPTTTSDIFWGASRQCGKCRVKLEDSASLSICGPVMVGDKVIVKLVILQDSKTGNILSREIWSAEVKNDI